MSASAGTALSVRLDDELWSFVAPRHRVPEIEVAHDGTASVGHVVQSLGVPLTEVGALWLEGVAATADARPQAGATVAVASVRRPQRVAERFVLDVHLGTLARRLRLLGVDTAYRNDATDDELIERAATQARTLLTKDRVLLSRRVLQRQPDGGGAFVRGSRPFDQLSDVLGRFAPPLRPWTRCVSCNGELGWAAKADVVEELEPGTRRCYATFARCSSCGRVYWRGAHARRLDEIVRAARSVHPRESEEGGAPGQ